MKTKYYKSLTVAFMMLATTIVAAQQPSMQFFRYNDKRGLNVFETSKDDTVEFKGVRVRIGGDFAMQYQGLSQENALVGDTLVDLASNFTLPTANLNFDVQLADGLRMHLRTYLSSRHHREAWVKGGYLQMDRLDWISPGFLSGFMDVATLRFGMDEINYGDAHFRRSDNARVIFNPFVGNYIMDAFTTEPHAQVTINSSGFLGVFGMSNGRLNQSPEKGDNGLAVYGKLGYDNQVSDNLRVRLTGSFYSSTRFSTRDYLYNGDRAGARYYSVLEGINDARPSDFLPRLNTGFPYQTAIQINPFLKASGFEFFGVFEFASDGRDAEDGGGGGFTQIGLEALYRFGADENLYIGGRYNSVTGEFADGADETNTQRINIGGGWFLTNNVLTKIEYVNQSYDGAGWDGSKFQEAEFNGVMIEAAISF